MVMAMVIRAYGTLPGEHPVLVNGRKVALVGRVSMDMMTVDLGPEEPGSGR